MKLYILMVNVWIIAHPCMLAADIVNLDKIGKALGFPSDKLIIEDYLEREKSAYVDKTVSGISGNKMPPFPPERIYKAYKITSKIPDTFLPIIITVVARDTYRSDDVKKMEFLTRSAREVPTQEDGHLPFGDFKVSETTTGFFLIQEMRVPAQPIHLEHMPPGELTYVDHCPEAEGCMVSFMSVPQSKVDVRVAKYMSLENFENRQKSIILIPGGEKYFNRFGHLDEENPKDGESFKRDEPVRQMIIDVFRGLNLEVLESPMLEPFRENQQQPATPVLSDLKIAKSGPTPEAKEIQPLTKKLEVSSSQRQDSLWQWLAGGLLFLLSMTSYGLIGLKRRRV